MDVKHLSKEQIFAFYADKTQHNLISLNVSFNSHNTSSAMNLFKTLVKPSSSGVIVC